MRIVIAGAGKVGHTVAEQLTAEGHDVVIIDQNRTRLEEVMNSMDVIGYCGSATNLSVMEEASAGTADVFLAVTTGDEVNLLGCVFARKMGAGHTMARIRNPEYMDSVHVMRELTELSLALNPDQVAAEEISRVLQFPTAARVESFPDCGFELITFRLPGESRLCGLSLREMDRKISDRVLICAVERGGEVLIPRGEFILQGGDTVTITGTQNNLRRFFSSAGTYRRPVKRVTIVGGSRIAVYLTMLLEKTGIHVAIIENDKERCRYLAEILPKADIVNGDGTNTTALQEMGLANTDGFVTLTNMDENNIIMGMYARRAGVEKVITKVNNARLGELMDDDLREAIVSPKELVAEKIVGYVRALSNTGDDSTMESLCYLGAEGLVAAEFAVGAGFRGCGQKLKDMAVRKDVIIACVERNGRGAIPDGQTTVIPGDRVIVVTTNRAIRALDEILSAERPA